MAPILGILASSIQGSKGTAYESIATVTLGSAASSATFSSIPSTYKHLQIRGIFMPTNTDFSAVFRLNGDSSSSNYVAHTLEGNGSSAVASSSTPYTPSSLRILYTQDSTGSQYPAGFVLDILDYANTNKYKTTRALAGIDTNGAYFGANRIALASGLWMSTSAVNSVTLYSAQGGYGSTLGSNFAANSSFALYGIK